jgi:hypothetical protein
MAKRQVTLAQIESSVESETLLPLQGSLYIDVHNPVEVELRPRSYMILGVLGCLLGPQGAVAQDGGIGPHPPAFISDFFQPSFPEPYRAVCSAPPTSCEVSYMFPIRTGKTCWCRDGLFVYSTGTTSRGR